MLIQKGLGYAYFGETKAKDVDWCRPLKDQGFCVNIPHVEEVMLVTVLVLPTLTPTCPLI
jgi:hypothetical protein